MAAVFSLAPGVFFNWIDAGTSPAGIATSIGHGPSTLIKALCHQHRKPAMTRSLLNTVLSLTQHPMAATYRRHFFEPGKPQFV